MKKLLIVPIVLALTVFSFYHEEIDGRDTNAQGNAKEEIQIKKRFNIYNNSKNEINNSVEVDKTVDENLSEKEFSVEIMGELNTTKENNITLNAVVKNVQNEEACNYWWYEDKELIDMGATLEKAFDLGKHNITVVVRDGNGTEVNSSVVVNAYNYESITTLHYDPYYGGLLYTERTVLNHKGQYVLYDDGVYIKELMTYDETTGMLLERVKEYYDNPEENRKTEFTYDDKGNRLVLQVFNSEGISINYMLYIYDENSSLIDMKFGTSAEDIEENEVPESDNDETLYEESPYVKVKIPEDVVRLNDNGQVIYEELYYGVNDKVVTTMTYDENNKLIHSERESKTSYDEGTTIIDYDKNGNEINKESKYKMEGEGICHYGTKSTFNESNQIETQVSTLLGGECSYIDEIKRIYSYDEEGEVIAVKATTEGEELSEAHSTLEVIKEYTNELDI